MKKALLTFAVLLTTATVVFPQSPQTFSHPGILSSQSELSYIKSAIGANSGSTAIAGYQTLSSNSKASLSYTATPYADVQVIASGSGPMEAAYRNDAHAAYAHALSWVVTGNTAYKDKAIQILNAWASTFQTLYCTESAQQTTLESSWALPIWLASAEIIKSYNNGAAGWSTTDVNKFKTFVRRTLTYVNGTIANAPNWRISKYLSLMSAGIFLDSTALYNTGYNGAITEIDAISDIGEMTELTRDFVHSQYNVIGMAMCCEIAHQQGDDALFKRTRSGATLPRLQIGAEAYVKGLLGTAPSNFPNYQTDSEWARNSAPYELLLIRYRELGIPVPQTEYYVLNQNRPETIVEDHFVGWLTLTHSDLPLSVNGVPSNLTATPTSEKQIILTWKDNSLNEKKFRIERSTDGTNWTKLDSVNLNITSYSDTTKLSAGVNYSYRVYGANSFGNSAYSNIATVTIPATLPAAPSKFTAMPKLKGKMSLSWTDNSNNEAQFIIERSLNGTDWVSAAKLKADVTSCTDSSLNALTTYQYRIKAVNSTGSSDYAVTSAQTLDFAPVAPDGLKATTASLNQINLSWNDNSNNEVSFRVERSLTGAAPWDSITTLPGNTASYPNTGLDANTTYYYRVLATNTSGNSDYSNVTSATTPDDPNPPAAPANLSATLVNNNLIKLTWTDNSSSELNYKVERSLTGTSAWDVIATANKNSTSYSNTGLSLKTQYYYRVQATNSHGSSAYSNTATVRTKISSVTDSIYYQAEDATLSNASAMTNHTGYKGSSFVDYVNQIDSYIDWNVNAPYAVSANINIRYSNYSAVSGDLRPVDILVNGTKLGNLTFALTASWDKWTIKTLENAPLNSGSNIIRAIATEVNGGPNIDEISISFLTALSSLGVPVKVSANALSNSSIRISWIDKSNDGTSFIIERKAPGSADFSKLCEIPVDSCGYTDTNLLAASTYEYRVSVSNGTNKSNTSASASATTPVKTAVESVLKNEISLRYTLNSQEQNAVISYSLPQRSQVSLVIYDMNGKVVQTLVNGFQLEGVYNLPFNTVNLTKSIYIARLKANNKINSIKLVVIK
ncbi:MAG: fibronectin type III domain-containing protein [Bacteroidota bacterium]|nr:fibronectin type III domain-containing protein [Bacteroidota bacterium]